MSNFFRELQRDGSRLNRLQRSKIGSGEMSGEMSGNKTQETRSPNLNHPSRMLRLSTKTSMHSLSLSTKISSSENLDANSLYKERDNTTYQLAINEDTHLQDNSSSGENSYTDQDQSLKNGMDDSILGSTTIITSPDISDKQPSSSTLIKAKTNSVDTNNVEVTVPDIQITSGHTIEIKDVESEKNRQPTIFAANDRKLLVSKSTPQILSNNIFRRPRNLFGGLKSNLESNKLQSAQKSLSNGDDYNDDGDGDDEKNDDDNVYNNGKSSTFNYSDASDDYIDDYKPLLRTISLLKGRYEAVKKKLYEINSEISKKNEKLNQKTQELKELKNSYGHINTSMNSLQSILSELQTEKMSYFDTLTDLKLQNSSSKKQLSDCKSEIDFLRSHIDSLKQKFLADKEEHNKQELEMKSLREKIMFFSENLSEEKNRCRLLAKELEVSRENYGAAIVNESESRKAFERLLTQKIHPDLKETLSKEMKHISQIISLQIDNMQQSLIKSNSENCSRAEENQKLNISDAKSEMIDSLIKNVNISITEKFERLSELFKTNVDGISEIQSFEQLILKNLSGLNETSQNNLTNMNKIELQLSEFDKFYQTNKEVIANYEKKTLSMQQEIDRINDDKVSMKEKLNSLKWTNDNLQSELMNMESSNSLLKSELQVNKNELIKLQENSNIAEARFNELEKFSSLETNAAAKKLNDIDAKYKVACSEKDLLKNQILGLQSTITTSENKFNSCVSNLEKKLESLKNEKECIVIKEAKELESANTKKNKLEFELKLKKNELKIANEENQKLQKKLQEYERNKTMLTNQENQNFNDKTFSLEQKISTLEERLREKSKVSDENSKLVKEVKSLNSQMIKKKDLESKLTGERESRKTLEKEIQDLRKKFLQAQTEMENKNTSAKVRGKEIVDHLSLTQTKELKALQINEPQPINKKNPNQSKQQTQSVTQSKAHSKQQESEDVKNSSRSIKKTIKETTKKEDYPSTAVSSIRQKRKLVEDTNTIDHKSTLIKGKKRLISQSSESEEYDEFSFDNMDELSPLPTKQYSKVRKTKN